MQVCTAQLSWQLDFEREPCCQNGQGQVKITRIVLWNVAHTANKLVDIHDGMIQWWFGQPHLAVFEWSVLFVQISCSSNIFPYRSLPSKCTSKRTFTLSLYTPKINSEKLPCSRVKCHLKAFRGRMIHWGNSQRDPFNTGPQLCHSSAQTQNSLPTLSRKSRC